MSSSIKKLQTLEDQDLLSQAISENQPIAASELFSRYIELVYGVCLKYMGNKQDAEDELMHVYELFIQKIKKHDVDNVKSWLYVLTKNHCLGVLRKQKRSTEKFDQFVLMYSEENFHPIDSNQKEEELLRLEACIEQLNQMQSQCIRAFYFEKRSYEEISSLLGINWNKIRSFIQNGRRNLKNCMSK